MNVEFKNGQKVKNLFGKILTVSHQNGNQVFVYEELTGWYHPTKLYKVGN